MVGVTSTSSAALTAASAVLRQNFPSKKFEFLVLFFVLFAILIHPRLLLYNEGQGYQEVPREEYSGASCREGCARGLCLRWYYFFIFLFYFFGLFGSIPVIVGG
ncbi:hypothetical protein ZIOFF_067704 [Zingiber officinale]|uniref:Uncharacterized protein n=1 Tax=Zingiber officinale TaxID=94328 RepID=A0A8J5C6U9_ZINOF|nr:hypothetical protein ZIOFF_067704 [Zingiber officinale]